MQSVGVTTGAGANELLGDDRLVEIVKLLALDTTRKVKTVKELGGAHAHGVDVHALGSHLLNELDSGSLARLLVDLSLGADVIVGAVVHHTKGWSMNERKAHGHQSQRQGSEKAERRDSQLPHELLESAMRILVVRRLVTLTVRRKN